jgi:undecaprenyl diphosphate synthase
MDGNGRWAQRRHHPRIFGHVRGASRIQSVVREADRLGVKALTLYAFSTENWSRPEHELSTLWNLLKKYLRKETETLLQENVRLRVIGELERMRPDVQEVLANSIKRLENCNGLQLNFALSYGARTELVRAARLFAEDCVNGRTKLASLDETKFEDYLWTRELGDLAEVDLVIRTSGEKRVSNFLLWQSAYAEYVFMDLCWPDFGPANLRDAIEEYSSRERRFGKIAPAPSTGVFA